MPGLIILPVELRHRELTSRIATAVHLVKAGASVVIGQQWAIFNNVDFWPRGVILFKTLNAIQAENMARFKAAGHTVVAMDEEVLTYASNFKRTIAHTAKPDLFLAQSQPHADDVRAIFHTIVVTGNPRAEQHHHFADEAAEIRAKHGPFILFNTNYPTINSIWGDAEKVFEISCKAGNGDRAQHDAWVKWETENRDALHAMMVWAHPYRRVVVRPHPGEQSEYWEGLAGFTTIRHSEAAPWMMAAELVVHTGCTTGIEAALAGVPVLNIETSPNPVAERITAEVNYTVTNWEDATRAISEFLYYHSGPIAAPNTSALETYFPNHRAGKAAENIATELLRVAGHGAVDWSSATGRYHLYERDPTSRTKFSATKQEISALFHMAQKRAGLGTRVEIMEIDEGVFVIEPR